MSEQRENIEVRTALDALRDEPANAIEAASAPLPAVIPAEEKPMRPGGRGGKLRTGGKPGNRGGGRPKESYRKAMRKLLGRSIAQINRDLDKLEETNGAHGTLANAEKEGIVQGPLTRADVLKLAAFAAKYGVGTEDKKEIKKEEVRYVIKVPQRISSAATLQNEKLVGIVEAPKQIPSDLQSDAVRGETE